MNQVFIHCFTLLFVFCDFQYLSDAEFQSAENAAVAAASSQHPVFCGHFNVSDNSSFDIFDRETHNKGFAHILATDTIHEKIYSAQIKEGCQLIFCAINLATGQNRFCERFTGYADLSTSKYTFSVSISCSCKVPIAGCDKSNCSAVPLKHGICVQFYKESNCSECRYDSYKLPSNITIHPTNNSFSVDSLIVKENCSLEIKSYHKEPIYYSGRHNSIQLSYFQKFEPANFKCICDGRGGSGNGTYDEFNKTIFTNNTQLGVVETSDGNSHNSGSLSPPFSDPVIFGFAGLALLILCLVSTAIALKYYKARKKLLRLADEAINKFTNGTSDVIDGELNVNFIDGEGGDEISEKCHYISLGYLEALGQPYYSRCEISLDDLTINENVKLGEGNFGKVCQGQLFVKSSGEIIDVAVKIAKRSTNIIYFSSLLDEIKILSYLGAHPNVVSIVGAFTQNIRQRDALLLLELCSKGNLRTYLCSNRNLFEVELLHLPISQQFSSNNSNHPYQPWSVMMQEVTITKSGFSQLLQWSQEIANGMDFLSSRKVVHIDLAARNILLTDDLTSKIGDFGLSRRIQNVGNYAKLGDDCGLPISWMALESLRDKRFTNESDVWSYGILLWELFELGNEPYHGIHMCFDELKIFLEQDKRLGKPVHASGEIYLEMCKCWSREPADRPTFHKLKEFFQMQLML